MHHRITQADPADLDYVRAQTAKVGADAKLKLRGAAGETNWLSLTPGQMLAVEEALKPDATPPAFKPITVSITCNTPTEAMILWCALGQGRQPILDLAEKYFTEQQVADMQVTMTRKYGGTYPVWDELDTLLKAEGIINP